METSSDGFRWILIIFIGFLQVNVNAQPACNDGWELCKNSPEPMCVVSGCQKDKDNIVESRACKTGKFYCAAIDSCVDECPSLTTDKLVSCPPDEPVCLWNGDCMEPEKCSELTPTKRCPKGTEFCLSLNDCVEGGCEPRSADSTECEPNTVFCLSSGTCEKEGNCGVRPPHTYSDMCPEGYVYCLSNAECIKSNTKCDVRPTDLSRNPCPTGTIFCSEKQGCVSDSESCQSRNLKPKACPRGTTLCLDSNRCSSSCSQNDMFTGSNPSCPTNLKFNHTTCLSTSACPFKHTCCPDTDSLHHQCVDERGKTNPIALNLTCNVLNSEAHKTGVTCESPEDCHPGSICCNNTCRSVGGKINCPVGTIFCNFTNKCITSKEKCGESCEPETILCLETNKCSAVCKGDTHRGVPWMLPGPLYVNMNGSAEINNGATINSLFTNYDLTKKFLVKSSSSFDGGQWQKRTSSDSKWENITNGSTVLSTEFIRVLPTVGIFGINTLTLTIPEKEHFEHRLVQLVAPRLPSIRLIPKANNLTMNEDQTYSVKLNNIIDIEVIGDSDHYWKSWKMAQRIYGGLINNAAVTNILNPSDESTKILNGLLRNPNKKDTEIKIRFELIQNTKKNVEDTISSAPARLRKTDLAAVTILNGKRKMKLEDAIEVSANSAEDLDQISISVRGLLDAHGDLTIKIMAVNPREKTSFDVQQAASSSINNELDLTIKIKQQNDAPRSKDFVDRGTLPKIRYGEESKGISAGKLAEIFFVNTEGQDDMGLAILVANSSKFGQWEFKETDKTPWKPITGLSDEISLSPLNWNEAGIADPLIVGQTDSCDMTAAFMDKNVNTSFVDKCTKGSSGRLRGMPFESDAELTTYTFTDGKADISGINPAVNAYLLTSDVMIRFNLKNKAEKLSSLDLQANNQFIFKAWDMLDKAKNKNVERRKISVCSFDCNSTDSLSRSLARIDPILVDCTDLPIVNSIPKVFDKCGICGGDSSKCTEICARNISESAVPKCGKCMEKPQASAKADGCLDSCKDTVLKKLKNKDVCVPVEDKNITLCDGTLDSTALINKCGICVLGNTNLNRTEGMDKCGVCDGSNECLGCDGKPNSNFFLDLCGKCLKRDDKSYNSCQKLVKLTPPSIDLQILDSVKPVPNQSMKENEEFVKQRTIEARAIGVPKDYRVANCNLVPSGSTGTAIESSKVRLRGEILKSTFSSFDKGEYNLQCNFTQFSKVKDDSSKDILITSDETVSVVDTADAKVEVINKDSFTTDNELKLKVTGASNLTEAIFYLRRVNSKLDSTTTDTAENGPKSKMSKMNDNKENNLDKGSSKSHKVIPLDVKEIKGTTVTCLLPDMNPGKYSVEMSLVPINLNTIKTVNKGDQINIRGSEPKLIEANVDEEGRVLTILCNMDIDVIVDKCENLFKDDIIPTGSYCKVRGKMILIRLGEGSTIQSGTVLEPSDVKVIIEKGADPDVSPSASNSVTVKQIKSKDSDSGISFELTGDQRICNGIIVGYEVKKIRGIRFKDAVITWNLTWVDQNGTQADTLNMWDIIGTVQDSKVITTGRNKEIYTFNSSLIIPGYEYMLVAGIEGPETTSPTLKSVTFEKVKPEENYMLNIDGPTEVFSTRNNRYKANVFSCQDDMKIPQKLKYVWETNWDNIDFGTANSHVMVIKKGSLRGGKNYILTVTAIQTIDGVDTAIATGSIEITTKSLGAVARIKGSSLKIGNVDIAIDASASEDLDNPLKALYYSWSCETINGTTCYGYVGGLPTMFEALLNENIRTQSVLQINKNTLPPNKYIFTVNVSNGLEFDTDSIDLEIGTGNIPIIEFLTDKTDFDPKKAIKVRAEVTGQAGMTVQWSVNEVDLFGITPSLEEQVFTRRSNKRKVSFILPKPSDTGNMKWEGLDEDTTYTIVLTATNPSGQFSEAQVVITTNSPPNNCTLEINPTSGKGFSTKFDTSAIGCYDAPSDYPLLHQFGYEVREKGTNKKISLEPNWYGEVSQPDTENPPAVSTYLPAMSESEQLIPVLRSCDAQEYCILIYGDPVGVGPPVEISEEVLLETIESIKTDFSDDSTTPKAIATASSLLRTLTIMDPENPQILFLDGILSELYDTKIASLKNRMTNKETWIISRKIIQSTINLNNVNSATSEIPAKIYDLQNHLKNVMMGKPQPIKTASPIGSITRTKRSDVIAFPKTDKDFDAIRNPRGRRAKRSAGGANATSTTTAYEFTRDQVFEFLQVSEQTLAATEIANEIEAQRDSLILDIPNYMSGLCNSLDYESLPQTIPGNQVAIEVQKSTLINQADTLFEVSNGEPVEFVNYTSLIVFGAITNRYETWDCGMTNEDGTSADCYGACIGTAQLNPEEFQTLYSFADPPGELIGSIIGASLMNPETGSEIPIEPSNDRSIIYQIPIDDFIPEQNTQLKCYGWFNETWNGTVCVNRGRNNETGVNYQSCGCSIPTFVAAYKINITATPAVESSTVTDTTTATTLTQTETTTVTDTTTIPSLPTNFNQVKNVSIRITNVDYDKVVGNNKQQFIDKMTVQFAEKMNISATRIRNFNVFKGSIVIEFEIHNSLTRTNAPTAEEVYELLQSQVSKDGLVLFGLQNEELKIMPQKLDGSGPKVIAKEEPTLLPIIIGAVVGGVILILLIVFCITWRMKNKRRMDKVTPMQSAGGSHPPTYRSIQGVHSLDGTAASLKKNKKYNSSFGPTGVGSMYADEGLYIERKSTADSNASSRGSSGFHSGTEEQVPEPFQYLVPTKEEMDKSEPIPSHIQEKLKNETFDRLPGTPEGH